MTLPQPERVNILIREMLDLAGPFSVEHSNVRWEVSTSLGRWSSSLFEEALRKAIDAYKALERPSRCG